ncbi:sulfurtransferase complex subunit TusC [bacterium]|nr:sulfurtransferase complex subunit TusC [bacterium]MBU1615632.1 sulfurtransferase complex subunit TusC [bacterium]
MEEQAKIMFIMRNAPHGSIYAFEGLETILIMGAYEQDISLVFLDDGVYAIKKGQDTSELEVKPFWKTFRALEGYDIEKLYVDEEALVSRGLTPDDLVVDVEVRKAGEIAKLMAEQDAILPF